MMNNKYFRLRPSVGFVPINVDNNKEIKRFDFFLSNTRRTIPILFSEPLLPELVKLLDGNNLVDSIIEQFGREHEKKIHHFLNFMISKCIIEDNCISEKITNNPHRRVLNFIGDYVPYNQLFDVWNKITECQVVIFGLGAIGSWVSVLLVQSGITKLTLIDNDIVKENNLNRSLFTSQEIGMKKTTAISNRLKCIQPNVKVNKLNKEITEFNEILEILTDLTQENHKIILVNCADFPNVDTTSWLVHQSCMKMNIPYIIAGGYNLHLSLIGPTIIPYETACFDCMNITLEEMNSADLKNVKKLVRQQRNIGNLAPLAGVSSSFIVNEVIRIASCSSYLKPAMTNRRGEYNFLTNKINFIDLPKRDDCPSCGSRHLD